MLTIGEHCEVVEPTVSMNAPTTCYSHYPQNVHCDSHYSNRDWAGWGKIWHFDSPGISSYLISLLFLHLVIKIVHTYNSFIPWIKVVMIYRHSYIWIILYIYTYNYIFFTSFQLEPQNSAEIGEVHRCPRGAKKQMSTGNGPLSWTNTKTGGKKKRSKNDRK